MTPKPEAQAYSLPSVTPDRTLRMTIDGCTYILQRVPIERLPAFRGLHNLVPVGPIGGPNTWPPAILYHPAPAVGADGRPPSDRP